MNFLTLFWFSQPTGGAGGAQGGGVTPMLLMFAMIIGVMYFMVIRPQQKRFKDHKKMLESVQRGDAVTLSGGMRGKVHELKETTVLVEIAKNVVVEFEKNSIQSVKKEA